jgi:hypothetical protein
MVYGIVKKVMDAVHKTYPNIQFLTQTKRGTGSGSYFKAPKLIKLGSQCTVEHLTRRTRLANLDYTEDVALAKQWKKSGVKVVLKSYERYPAAKNYPLIKFHRDQQFFKLFTDSAKGALHSEAHKNTPYSFSALGQYLQLKMLFDINIDLDKEIKNFCKFAYPGAEKEMVLFYQEMERLYSKRTHYGVVLIKDIYTEDKLKTAMQLLNKASKKVKKGSIYFDNLYQDFKNFYKVAQQEGASKNSLAKRMPFKVITLPNVTGKDIELSAPDTWEGAVKNELKPIVQKDDFQSSSAYLVRSATTLYIGVIAKEQQIKRLKAICFTFSF